jgi:hypothetical protein
VLGLVEVGHVVLEAMGHMDNWGWDINPLMETRLTSEISPVAKTKTKTGAPKQTNIG